MIVTKETFQIAIENISKEEVVSLDCETSGLRPFHGDKLFSIAISTKKEDYYFNFQKYDDIDHNLVLDRSCIPQILAPIHGTLIGQNIKFDLHFLNNECPFNVDKLHIHDTMVTQRLIRNDLLSLSLDSLAKEVGETKDTAVEEYIKKYKLYEVVTIPGKKTRMKLLKYHWVPFDIISTYAMKDARITFKLYQHQLEIMRKWDNDPKSKKINALYQNECQLLKVCFEIEREGIRLASSYVEDAIKSESRHIQTLEEQIQKEIGKKFVDSRKSLIEIFPNAVVKLTEKGNKSYDQESLSTIDHPLARKIEKLREHQKRKNTYFEAFKFHCTKDDKIHPSLNQHAAQTGRFSITNPALQTLNKEEDTSNPYPIRKSFIPREGNCFVEMDYDSMEFVLMCDYAGEMTLIKKIMAGWDPHEATASLAGVIRRVAKTLNFLLLYGGGIGRLAEALGIGFESAASLKKKYFQALPNIKRFMWEVSEKAKNRGFIFNFLGRRFHFPDPKWAYKAPNALIQGSGADVCKLAMVRIHEFLKNKQTKMVLQIHDAILFDMPPHEFNLIPHLKKLMEEAYPHKHIPLSVSVEHSFESWGDLVEGEPVVRETRESIQAQGEEIFKEPKTLLVCQN